MTQPKALRLANELLTDRALECFDWAHDAGYELRRLHKENKELRRVLYQLDENDENDDCVAIVNKGMGGIEWLRNPLPDDTPLYTAPPKRKLVGLTEEDIDLYALDIGVTANKAPAWLVKYAKDIESKLKEKNT